MISRRSLLSFLGLAPVAVVGAATALRGAAPVIKHHSSLPDGRQAVSIGAQIDARACNEDLIAKLPEILRRNNEEVERQIVMGLRNGRYGWPAYYSRRK